MRMRTLVTVTAAGIASLVLAAPAAAHPCSAHARGGEVTHKTKEAHVFTKRDRRYACAAKIGRAVLLPGLDTLEAQRFGDGNVAFQITLSGVFVGYGRYTLHPAGGGGDTQQDIFVVDLRTGKTVVQQRSTETSDDGVSNYLEGFVMKRNGSVGWIGQHHTYEVHQVSTVPGSPGRVKLDSGDDIDPKSLALSSDRRTMTWTKGGVAKSAPLP